MCIVLGRWRLTWPAITALPHSYCWMFVKKCPSPQQTRLSPVKRIKETSPPNPPFDKSCRFFTLKNGLSCPNMDAVTDRGVPSSRYCTLFHNSSLSVIEYVYDQVTSNLFWCAYM